MAKFNEFTSKKSVDFGWQIKIDVGVCHSPNQTSLGSLVRSIPVNLNFVIHFAGINIRITKPTINHTHGKLPIDCPGDLVSRQ